MVDADGSPPPAPASRAGRNLPAAIGSGVVLAFVVVASLFVVKWVFAVVVVAALLISAHELRQAFGRNDIQLARTPLFVGTLLIPSVAYVWGPTAMVAATGAVVLSILGWRIRRGHEGYVRDVTASTFVIAYLPFMAGFLMLTLSADDGPQRAIVFILLTVSNDIGGYAAGVLFGRHPIAAQISPKKSWEGFAGSVVLQGVVGALAFVYLLDAPWWQGLIAGLVLAITATAGDFVESAIKRDLGVKDMGTFLPGHGGMMDRLDSLIPECVHHLGTVHAVPRQRRRGELITCPNRANWYSSPPRAASRRVHLMDLDRAGRRQAFEQLGVPAFRADQVSRQWLSRLSDDPSEWTDLPADLRPRVAGGAPAAAAHARPVDRLRWRHDRQDGVAAA